MFMKENVRPYWESRGSNSSYWTYTETKERFYTQRETGKNEIDLLRGEVQKNRRVVSEKVEESGSRLVEISKELQNMRRLVDEDLRGRENKVKKKTKEMNISYNEIRSSLQSLERQEYRYINIDLQKIDSDCEQLQNSMHKYSMQAKEEWNREVNELGSMISTVQQKVQTYAEQNDRVLNNMEEEVMTMTDKLNSMVEVQIQSVERGNNLVTNILQQLIQKMLHI